MVRHLELCQSLGVVKVIDDAKIIAVKGGDEKLVATALGTIVLADVPASAANGPTNEPERS